jgi:MoaA/NifB/PqqE/SkfB family radical SAM enzyme
LKVGIVTNGTLVTEEDLDILHGNLGYFIVSLDSHLQKVHDFIRGKGTYEKVIKLLPLLNQKETVFSVNTVISKLNIDHLLELYGFLKRNQYFQRHDLNLLTKSYFASGKKTNKFYKAYSFGCHGEKTHAIEKLNEYMLFTEGRKTSYVPQVHACITDIIKSKGEDDLNRPLCNVFKRKLIIDLKGDIRLCYHPAYPAIANITDKHMDLKEIWESEKTQQTRKKMELCVKRCGKELCNNKRLPFNRV